MNNIIVLPKLLPSWLISILIKKSLLLLLKTLLIKLLLINQLPFSISRILFFPKRILKSAERYFLKLKLRRNDKKSSNKFYPSKRQLSFVSNSQPKEAFFLKISFIFGLSQNICSRFTGKFSLIQKSRHLRNGHISFLSTKN